MFGFNNDNVEVLMADLDPNKLSMINIKIFSA